jgi:dihydrofolate reductase
MSPSVAAPTSSGRRRRRGKVDELVISTAPVILGAGKRLFEGFDRHMDLEVAKVYSSPYATHVRYPVTK